MVVGGEDLSEGVAHLKLTVEGISLLYCPVEGAHEGGILVVVLGNWRGVVVLHT